MCVCYERCLSDLCEYVSSVSDPGACVYLSGVCVSGFCVRVSSTCVCVSGMCVCVVLLRVCENHRGTLPTPRLLNGSPHKEGRERSSTFVTRSLKRSEEHTSELQSR